MYILEVKNLKKYYGEEPNIVRAINGINLKVVVEILDLYFKIIIYYHL